LTVDLVQKPVQYHTYVQDSEITDAVDSLSFAEKKLNHKLAEYNDKEKTIAYAQKW